VDVHHHTDCIPDYWTLSDEQLPGLKHAGKTSDAIRWQTQHAACIEKYTVYIAQRPMQTHSNVTA
jgi:hypothetical protein